MTLDPLTTAATNAAAAAVTSTTNKLIEKLSVKFAKDKYDEITFLLSKGLPDYLNSYYAKCNTIKTLLNRNDSIPIREVYVEPRFKLGNNVILSSIMLDSIRVNDRKVIVTGLAGSGKSVFLKYCFTSVIEKGHSFYPIFLELRSIRDSIKNEVTLSSIIFQSIKECCPSFTRAQFDFGLRIGAFYFLVDGLDEVDADIRDFIVDQIQSLALRFPKNAIILTSRPSQSFVSWDGFDEAKLLPFDIDQCCDYVRRLRYDEDRKLEFIADLKSGLFEKNEEFLSNPLLCSMMLLTYDAFNEIPEKKHIFYKKSFDVLSREHDSSKARYKRKLYSGLTIDEIEYLIMIFCAISYEKRIISFEADELRRHISSAIEICGYESESNLVVLDLCESLSILEIDGGNFDFVHRSFQEYFYAKFVVTDRRLSLKDKIVWLFDYGSHEETIKMIYDMDTPYFEDDFLIPSVRKINRKIAKYDPSTHPSQVLSAFFVQVDINSGNIGFIHNNDRANAFVFSEMVASPNAWVAASKLVPYDMSKKDDFTDTMKKNFPDGIKIHHTNNKKIISVGCHEFAERMKIGFKLFEESLLVRQKNRRSGLESLIKRRYTE